jgi:hypothetical protein
VSSGRPDSFHSALGNFKQTLALLDENVLSTPIYKVVVHSGMDHDFGQQIDALYAHESQG